jgi:hypothetical protein
LSISSFLDRLAGGRNDSTEPRKETRNAIHGNSESH